MKMTFPQKPGNKLFHLSILSLGMASILSATVTIDSLNTPVVFDFQTFGGNGFAPAPTPGSGILDSNNWSATGFSDGSIGFGGNATTGDFARGSSSGGVSTGGIYAFQTGGGNVALGVQPTADDFNPGSFLLRLENATGTTVTAIEIAYELFALNNAGRANSLNFAYGVGSSEAPDSWIPIDVFEYISAQIADTTPTWESTSVSTSIFGLDLGPGEFFHAAWTGADIAGSGSRDEFAIDNISITAVPEPGTPLVGLLIAAGLCLRWRLD